MNTVLLIDDDEVILAAFSLALRGQGYRVFEASTGAAGFELAKQQLPDLIITDIRMPAGDGETLLKQIREHPELAHTQVVLMTGGDQIELRHGMDTGADDFLRKPVALMSLLNCVEARLKRARVHGQIEGRMLEQLRASLHSNLPHEFFTPLGGILGLTEILRSEWAAMPPQEVTNILADVYHSALRLHRTLRNYLLALELRAADQSKKLPERLPASEVEESIWSAVRTTARRHGRKTDINVKIEPCDIFAHAMDVNVMMEETLDNACLYSPPGTPIEIEFSPEGVLTISDMGHGMEKEQLRRVGASQQFERHKPEQGGLGLGLMLLHRLAMKCGTTPVIESQPGKGTQVRVAFVKTRRESEKKTKSPG